MLPLLLAFQCSTLCVLIYHWVPDQPDHSHLLQGKARDFCVVLRLLQDQETDITGHKARDIAMVLLRLILDTLRNQSLTSSVYV